MDRLSAPEQNRLLGGIANLLRKIEQDSGPEFLPKSLDVMGLVRQLALPSAETVEKLSYGDPLFRMPTQSNIPITTDRGYLAEVLGMAPVVPAASRATTRISNEMADQLVKAITRNPEATAPGALQAAGEMSPLARITGYHGSPHGPISQFDFEKVGSGSGTTNFGYGTYIAEHPAIAGMFRKGRTPSSDNPDGFLYQVDIPDEIIPKMLNWYEEVPEGVRKNLSEKAAQKFGTGLTGTTGERLYKDLAFSFKMDGSKNPEKDASKWLAEQGVPGIQYENLQMVRGMGRDTNNYVLFEPEKIKIEKINEENAQDFLSARGLLEPQAGAKGFNVVQPGDKVSGLTVREDVPNMSSISASLDDYEILSGIREVPRSAFDKEYLDSLSFESLDKRTKDLAEQIKQSKEINPMIVGVDSKGAYIIEGGHRFDALMSQDTKSIPAVVVIDKSDPPTDISSLLD